MVLGLGIRTVLGAITAVFLVAVLAAFGIGLPQV